MQSAIESVVSSDASLPPELQQLGVRGELPSSIKLSLDSLGYAMLPDLIAPETLGTLRAAFDRLSSREGALGGREVHTEPGTHRLSNLVDKSPDFDVVYTHPTVLSAVWHVLQRPFKLSSLNAREPLAGQGHQGLHADWGPRRHGEPFHVVNSLWLLDPFEADNGATRVIPGSHRLEGNLTDYMADTAASHPDEQRLLAPAGTVIIFNAHSFHGGTRNVSGHRRRVLHCYFTAREHQQQLVQRDHTSAQTLARLTPAQRWLLDI